MSEAAFYCMSSAAYFLGAVGMINSLRLQGHSEPIYLLDLGLTTEQRELLAAEATIVAAPPGTQPWLSKTIAPLAHPAETMVLIDTDIIVTRSLGELIERAAGGGVVAFENDVQRYVPEWGELLDLGPLRPGPYVSSGLVVLGGETGAEVLRLLDDRQRRVEFERSYFAGNDQDYPFVYLDQDVLNAILAREAVEPQRLEALSHRLAPSMPPFAGLRIVDPVAGRCAYADGAEPYVVHHILPDKPWRRPMFDAIYSQLLKRFLVGSGLAIRVPTGTLPLRMRTGAIAYLERKRVDASVRLRWSTGIALHRLRGRLRGAPR
jgi:hypothetical protein